MMGIGSLLILATSAVDEGSSTVVADAANGQAVTVRIQQWTAESPDQQLSEALDALVVA